MELFSSARTAEFSVVSRRCLFWISVAFKKEREEGARRPASGFIIDGDHAAPGEPSQGLGK